MCARYYENYDNPETEDNTEKGVDLPDHFESKYKLKEEAMEYEAGEGGYRYKTDKYGRIAQCSGELSLHHDGERNIYAQRKAGGEDRRMGEKDENGKDDGGHIIGRRFGGSPEIDNMIAQDSKLNRGEYKKMENDWEAYLNEKNEDGSAKYHVYTDIRCKYRDENPETGEKDSKRPSDMFVYSKVTDSDGNIVDKQVYWFRNEPDPETKIRDLNSKEDDRDGNH